MNKNEVRIGNIVQFIENKDTLTSITESCFEGNYIEKTFEGCDLDDDGFRMLGFKFNKDNGRYENNGWRAFFYDCWHISYENEHCAVSFEDYFKVHEFQNLVFSISGIELDFSQCDS